MQSVSLYSFPKVSNNKNTEHGAVSFTQIAAVIQKPHRREARQTETHDLSVNVTSFPAIRLKAISVTLGVQ
jgi:hypothetical protein